MIKAIIFDLDGVLIDSENFVINIYRKFIEEYDMDLKVEDFYIMIGGNRRMNHLKLIYDKSKMGWSEELFRERLDLVKKRERANFSFDQIVFKETKPVLAKLHELGYKIVCASSSHIDYINRALKECEITEYFDIIVSGLDFKESKPNPEIYNYCVDKLGFDKSECVVVEDSTYGIEAANRANLFVYGRKDERFGVDQSHADKMINDLNDLLIELKK